MADMKDSGIEWIGEIPTDWDTKAIRFLILEHFSGAWGNDEKTDSDNNRICMRIADFDYFRMQFKENVEYTIRNYTNTEIANKTLRYGDLLIEKSGGGEKTPVGRTVVYRLNNNALFANFMDCIRLKENEYNYEFAKYVFYSLYNNGITNLYYNKTTGIQNLSMQKYLREVKLPFPTLIEQGKIADFLDKKCAEVDTLHTDIEKQIETLEEYEKSIITEVVTKGLDPDVEMKDSGIEWIGNIPKNWNISRLKYELETSMKYGASEAGVEYSDDLPRYIRITDITNNNRLKTEGKLSLTVKQANGYMLEKDTVLFARSGGTVGKTFLYKPEYGKAAFAGYLISAIPDKKKMQAEWLYYYSLSNVYWDWANQIFTQATIQNIGADKYSNMPIPIPSIDIQEEIIHYLEKKCAEIDGVIVDKKKQLETLEEYKKSLIYEYVTGKKEVLDNE